MGAKELKERPARGRVDGANMGAHRYSKRRTGVRTGVREWRSGPAGTPPDPQADNPTPTAGLLKIVKNKGLTSHLCI